MEIFSLLFLKTDWEKTDAVVEVEQRQMKVLSVVEDDNLIVCVIKEIPVEESKSRMFMLTETIFCLCKIDDSLLTKIDDLHEVKEPECEMKE
jgi:hypothetical protein